MSEPNELKKAAIRIVEKAQSVDGVAALTAEEVTVMSTRSGSGLTGFEATLLDMIDGIETELRDHGPKIPVIYCATVGHYFARARAIYKKLQETYEA